MLANFQSFRDDQSQWYHNRRLQRSILGVSMLILATITLYYWSITNEQHSLETITGLFTSHNKTLSASPPREFLDPTRVALLMETRPLPYLPALLSHFIAVLDPHWVFRFVGSPESMALISGSRAMHRHIDSGKLVLTQIPDRYTIDSGETVSVTLTTLDFYQDFLAPAEWLLVFQADSIICAASNHSIEDWVSRKFAWVGAPWNLVGRGGNGGLSLRHVPPIIEMLKAEDRVAGDLPEDRWICDRLQGLPGALPTAEEASYFSVESVYTERPWGYHLRSSGKALDPAIWSDPVRRKQIFDYCPEVKLVLDLT